VHESGSPEGARFGRRKLKGKVNPSIVVFARTPSVMERTFPWTQYLGSIEPRYGG
jgi:hypothetical protein